MISILMLVSALSFPGIGSAHAADSKGNATVSVAGAPANELYRYLTQTLGVTPQRGIQSNSIRVTDLFLYLHFQGSLDPQPKGVEQKSDLAFLDQNALPQPTRRKLKSLVVIPDVELSDELVPNSTESLPGALFMILKSAGLSPSFSETYDGGHRFAKGFILSNIRCEIPEAKCEITGYGIGGF